MVVVASDDERPSIVASGGRPSTVAGDSRRPSMVASDSGGSDDKSGEIQDI